MDNIFFLNRNMITHLHEKCIFTLHKIVDTKTTNVWQGDWKSTHSIELGGD